MQLYAFDGTGRKVFIATARPGQDYFCMECKGRMRLRRTLQRKSHFFHLTDERQGCRHAGKSIFHIATQQAIQGAIGSAVCDQEVHFESIGRIADIAWHERKIVIEVQCSPISAQEVEERCRDYESVGWNVIWILHEKTFGRHVLSEAEFFLRNRTHYYTDINQNGGRIYDRGARVLFPITIAVIEERSAWKGFSKGLQGKTVPSFVQDRVAMWQYSAQGDVLWHARQEEIKDSEWEELLRSQKAPTTRFRIKRMFRAIRATAEALWHLLLERSCN